jgi:hypothetical protein
VAERPNSNAAFERSYECGFCRALRAMPWWKRVWLSLIFGIREEHRV